MTTINMTTTTSLACAALTAAVMGSIAAIRPEELTSIDGFQMVATTGFAALTGASYGLLRNSLFTKSDIPDFLNAAVFASTSLGCGALTLCSVSYFLLQSANVL